MLFLENLVVLAFKTIDRTAPIYLQTLVRPHASVPVLCSSTSAGRLVPPSLRANKGRSAKSWLPFCSGTSVVETNPGQCQDSGITRRLPHSHVETWYWWPLEALLWCPALFFLRRCVLCTEKSKWKRSQSCSFWMLFEHWTHCACSSSQVLFCLFFWLSQPLFSPVELRELTFSCPSH